jgi:hypothetical protein
MSAVSVPAKTGPAVTLPRAVALTIGELLTLLELADVRVENMPTEYTNVILVQGDEKTLVVRLPPKDMLQGSEDDLIMSGEEYPIPKFYDDLYPCEAKYPTKQGDIMELHANRIGEYTLNNCA